MIKNLVTKNAATKKIRYAILGIVIAASALFFWQKSDSTKISYSEHVVKLGTLNIKILATGTVQPENRLEIKPPVPGRVEQVLFKEGQKVRKGQILAWMSSTERAALLDSARASGVAELKKWQEIYPPTPILAPLDGTIVLKNVEAGETFASSDSLLSMSDRLTIKAQVDETDIAAIKVGQSAEIILDAYPDQKVPGTVNKVAFDATTVSNVTTYIVDVLPETVPEFMRSGMTANVTFFVNSKADVLLIQSEAVHIKDGRSVVLVKSDSSNIEREVETGDSNGKQVEIVSGLSEGEVVLSQQLKLENNKGGDSPFSSSRKSSEKNKK